MSDTRALSDLALMAVNAAESAAIASSAWIGRGEKESADQAAVDALRTGLNAMPMRGRIVIGEGERDEAPMLFIGEEVGTGTGPEIDIALDPLEGTTLTAWGMNNALVVVSFSPRGGLLNAPDTYMDKIAIGPGLPAGVIDLDASPQDNVVNLARAKGVSPSEITVCVLERERHQYIIDGVKSVGGRVRLISDGDVAGIMGAAGLGTGVDMYIGRGGAPEGVLAASALRCIGGQMQARLFFRTDDERERARRIGVTDLDRKYELDELASGQCLFVAAGVTQGDLVDAVRRADGMVHTHTLILDSADHSVRRVRSARPEA
ncbi:class II fructose-bisphosphatase [Maricaulis salignorans]|uniref:Fructose-1,6-bisphosphatase n=1 Tax=Maricaulis salignorans TaxID=144026 RepID=A0A1G9P8Y0_9PROT|nr:class II fructose-bisphosphatase [Maricaulis salignorans]SDL95023.1 fructose-1,6-bisphosphatase II / sedoheptulose-1,7-bisphosphatase [Maricaulis salignorans]